MKVEFEFDQSRSRELGYRPEQVTAKLKPCNECGAVGKIVINSDNPKERFVPACSNNLCWRWLQSMGFETRKEAVEAWNTDFVNVVDTEVYDDDLTPSYRGEKCLYNGQHEGFSCECDKCDHYQECFWEE